MRVILFSILFLSRPLYAAFDAFRLVWNDDPATTMTIGWNSHYEDISSYKVYYDTIDHQSDIEKYRFQKSVDRSIDHKGMLNTFVRLKNLMPNQSYYFVVAYKNVLSKRYWFTTAPNSRDARLSIVAGGDSRDNQDIRRLANILAGKLRPHVIMFGGDMTDRGTNSQWANWFRDWQLTIREDGHMIPVLAARGNHETNNQDIADLFDTPPGVYYALTFADGLLRTYTLNSESSTSGDQLNWLVQDLKNSQQVNWRIAQYHKPMRPIVGSKDEGDWIYDSWAMPFFEHNVQLVMESDSHAVKSTWPIVPDVNAEEGFRRDDLYGTVYVGEGCWGAPLRNSNDEKSWTRAAGSFNQFKWIWVDKNKMEVRTVKVDNAQDVGTIDENNRFSLPTGIDLWKPEAGEVVTLYNQRPKLAVLQPAEDAHFKVDEEIEFSWEMKTGPFEIDSLKLYINNEFERELTAGETSAHLIFSNDGRYLIRLEMSLKDGPTLNIERSVLVGEIALKAVFSLKGSRDDVEENPWELNFDSSDLEMTRDDDIQKVGLLFREVALPYRARINRAYIQFTVDEATSEKTNLIIQGFHGPKGTSFEEIPPSAREFIGPQVAWDVSPWQSEGEQGPAQQSNDLSKILQAIVDDQWNAGNTLGFVITGEGKRVAVSHDRDENNAPKLIVEYYLSEGEEILASRSKKSFKKHLKSYIHWMRELIRSPL